MLCILESSNPLRPTKAATEDKLHLKHYAFHTASDDRGLQMISSPSLSLLSLLLEKLGARFKVRQMVTNKHPSSEVLSLRLPALAEVRVPSSYGTATLPVVPPMRVL